MVVPVTICGACLRDTFAGACDERLYGCWGGLCRRVKLSVLLPLVAVKLVYSHIGLFGYKVFCAVQYVA